MKFQKFLAVALSSLLLWETPLLPQANVTVSAESDIQARAAASASADIQARAAASASADIQTRAAASASADIQARAAASASADIQAGAVPDSPEPESSPSPSASVASPDSEGFQPPSDPACSADSEATVFPSEPTAPSEPANPPDTEEPPVSNPDLPARDTEVYFQWVYLEQDIYEMSIGDTIQLEAEAEYPSEITWSSSEDGIASVSADGTVTANGIGTAQITATATAVTEEGTFEGTAVCEVMVENQIQLNHSSLSMYPGQSEMLAASLAAEESIAWDSSKPEVAVVNAQGEVSAQKAGTAVIIATTPSGARASCQVKVKKPSLSLRGTATAYVKSILTLKATAKPSGTIQWKSSNPKIASVNASGQVTPKKTGVVTITATCNGISQKCKVTVKNPSLKFKSQKAILFAGNTCRPDLTAKPSSELKWKSSNAKIATVNQEGEIVGKKAGTVTLTASLLGKKATCQVQVLENKHKFNRPVVTLMKGKTTALQLLNVAANESVSYRLKDDSWALAGYSVQGGVCEVTGKEAGTVILQAVYSIYIEGQYVTGVSECKVKIIDSGIIQQQTSVAVHTSKQLKLKNVSKSGLSITHTAWESSNAKVASVSQDGKIKGKASGAARITATVTYSDGTQKAFPTSVKVSNPKLKSSGTVMTIGKSKRLKLSGTNAFSTIKWKISKATLASVGQDGTVISGYNTGKATITVTVDGKKITHRLTVTNPQLKTSYRALAVGNTAQIAVKGASSKKKVTYKSKNKAVATVSKTGQVKAKSYGNAEISVKADGITLTFKVSVAPQRALDACKSGHQIMYSSTYSQARRMENGFYDCSALVFRAYGRDAGLLGGTYSYAPTAASMAYYLERTGKAISQQGLDVSQLLPGDLIFYGSASSPNGRYKNIYHVSMYYGDGCRLEKPLRYYYPDSNIVLIARPVR